MGEVYNKELFEMFLSYLNLTEYQKIMFRKMAHVEDPHSNFPLVHNQYGLKCDQVYIDDFYSPVNRNGRSYNLRIFLDNYEKMVNKITKFIEEGKFFDLLLEPEFKIYGLYNTGRKMKNGYPILSSYRSSIIYPTIKTINKIDIKKQKINV